MIKVIAKYSVRSDKIAVFKSISARLKGAADKEKGCMSFEILQDVKNEYVICMIEEWHDGESFAMHMQSNLFKTVMPKLNELLAIPPDVIVCRVLLS